MSGGCTGLTKPLGLVTKVLGDAASALSAASSATAAAVNARDIPGVSGIDALPPIPAHVPKAKVTKMGRPAVLPTPRKASALHRT